jgi:hypothetical protein
MTIVAPTQYENRLVAFLDILGWRELIAASEKDPGLIPKLGVALLHLNVPADMQRWFEAQSRLRGETFESPEDMQISQFSDCIVISVAATSAGVMSLLFQLLGLLRGLLYNCGYLVRGAITAGPMHHKGPIAFGPALTAAYDLERNSSIYPRIILHPSLEPAFLAKQNIVDVEGKPMGQFKWIRRSPDSFYFIDYLEPMGSGTGLDLQPMISMVSGSLSSVRKLITHGLRSHAYDPRKWDKYRWLADYFNEVNAEYPEARVDPIHVNEICRKAGDNS